MDRRVRAVLFDLDGTLYAQFPLRLAMICEMGLVCAASFASGGTRVPRVLSAFRRLREELRRQEYVQERLDMRQYSVVAERLRCSPDDVERIVQEWMYHRPLKWLSYCRRRGLVELLGWLEARGIPKGVLSDYPPHEKLVALGLSNRFDLMLSAVDADINAFKPHRRGYLAAAHKWGLAPSDVLYVGDRLNVDAKGALAAGMSCAVLTRRPVLERGVIAIRDFTELKSVLQRVS